MRGKTLLPPAPSTNDACHSGNACGEPAGKRARHRRRGFRLGAEDLHVRPQRPDGTPGAGDEPAAAEGRDDDGDVGRILEDLEPHGGVAGDEVVVIEGMHEGALDAGIGALLQRLPRDGKGHQHQRGAERLHALDLGEWGRLDDDHGAGDAGLPRGIGDALPGIAGADGPDAPLPLGVRQQCHGVGGAAELEGVDGLEILELEADVGKARPELEPHAGACAGWCPAMRVRAARISSRVMGRMAVMGRGVVEP